MLDKKIIEKIEKKIKQPITTTACGKWLPKTIKNETGLLLGETTLKRMFGFTNDPRTPHRSTLDVIAIFLGYKDYRALAEDLKLPDALFSLTPIELNENKQYKQRYDEKINERLRDYFFSLLKEQLKKEIDHGNVLLFEHPILSHAHKWPLSSDVPIIITYGNISRFPRIRIDLPNGLIFEIGIELSYKPAIETVIVPRDAEELQRLKANIPNSEEFIKYLPDRDEEVLSMLQREECSEMKINDICHLTISKIYDTINEGYSLELK